MMDDGKRKWLTVLVVVLIAWAIKRTFMFVDETEYVLVTRFGRPVGAPITRAGLHLKWFFDSRRSFDKRLLLSEVAAPTERLTKDKKNLLVDNYVCWRISDAQRFLQTVGDVTGAELRLQPIVLDEVAAQLGNVELSSLVNTDAGKVQIAQMMDKVTGGCRRKARDYGIEVVDVRIKRLNLPMANKESVFARMRAERERISKQYRAEGTEQATKIKAEADREKERILSEAYREAERTRGDGDAQSTRIYGDAFSRDPDFYNLVRTLQAYRKVIDDKTTAILSSDSELLRLLTQGRGAANRGKR